jgi:hypothetical protein
LADLTASTVKIRLIVYTLKIIAVEGFEEKLSNSGLFLRTKVKRQDLWILAEFFLAHLFINRF